LRHYYNAFKHNEEIAVRKAPLATRSNIIRIYDELIKRDAQWFFDDLFEKAQLYSRLITPLSDGVPAKLARQLLDLDRIGGTPAHILLLFVLAELPKANLTGICNFLVRYFVRRNLTDIPPTRDLARIFIEIVGKLREKTDGDADEIVRQGLLAKGRFATDDNFREKLKGNIYLENVDATRFVLCQNEEKYQTIEKLTDLWERDDKGRLVWTVEHIFPQGPNIPPNWVKMIADGNEERACEYRDRYAHQLGNLTISGYNSKLGNKSFEEKRDRKDARGRYVGYKNGLFLNHELHNAEAWTVERIVKRTDALVETAMRLFSLHS
jgi:hypothetical protein